MSTQDLNTHDELIGNSQHHHFLSTLAKNQNALQPLLFYGLEGIGKKRFALKFARMILDTQSSSHPDLLNVEPDSANGFYTIHTIRYILSESSLPPLEASKRVFIINDAHCLTEVCGNALLKTLEEPHIHTVFILLTPQIEQVLETIQSRCKKLLFQPIDTKQMTKWIVDNLGITLNQAHRIAILSHGSFARAKLLCSEGYRQIQDILENILVECFSGKNIGNILLLVNQLEKSLENTLVKPDELIAMILSIIKNTDTEEKISTFNILDHTWTTIHKSCEIFLDATQRYIRRKHALENLFLTLVAL